MKRIFPAALVALAISCATNPATGRRQLILMSEAEEIAQSVWATFLEVVPRFEGRSRVRTFLLGILRRKAAEASRADAAS